MMDDFVADFFQEPEDFRPKTPPLTESVLTRENGQELAVSLIGYHSLWAHVAWNAGIFFAQHIDQNPEIVRNKKVLELGAGAAFPSMISVLNGASFVVATDYPDIQLINLLKENMDKNLESHNDKYKAIGYLWGTDCEFLHQKSFDVIVMCDLVFNHTQHENMLKSCDKYLTEDGIIYCVFTHHRPWLSQKDLDVLRMAQEQFDFKVEHVMTHKMTEMFKEDPGDVSVRQSVHFYTLRR